MKKKPVSNTRTGKSNSVLRNFLTNLKENELHYENKQITQCVFLGVLRLKPVPSIFSSTNVPSNGASVVRSKPRKAKNNNSNKEVNKNVSKKTSINKVINGKITKKNSDKVKACVKKSPAKKSKIIKIKLNIDRNKSKLNMSNNSEEVTVESKNVSKLVPQNLINKQVVNQNSKTSTTFNPVDSLLNKLKQKIDVGCHSSGLGIYDVIDSIQEKQAESSTPVRRKLILPTQMKVKPKPMYHQPFTMPLSSSNSIISNDNSNMDKDDVIFVTDYKLGDSIVENISHSCDDVIFIDSPKAVKQKERTSPRSKVSNLQGPGLNGQHPRTATTVKNHILNDSGSTHNSDIIIISDDIKSRPSTPNDLIVVDDPREIRVSPRSKKSVESYINNSVTIPFKNKIVISDQDLNKPKCSLDKSRNQQLNLMIDDNVINTSIDKSSMPLLQTVEIKKLEVSSNQKTVDEKILQKPVEKPKQRRNRLIAANIPSIFLNTPMLLRSELAQKKAATVSKPKNREKSHPRLLRSELPKNSLLSKSFSEQKVVRQDRIEMRKCSSQENVFIPEESETIYINGKSLTSHKNIEQKKHSSPQIKNTSQNISTDRWEITKSTPNMEIKNQEMKSNQKPVSLKLTLTKTSKTTHRLPTPKEKSSKNQETQTERDIFVIESSNPQEFVKLSETVLNLQKDVDLIVANNPMYSARLLRSDLNQKSPTLNCAITNTKLLHNVGESTDNLEIIVIPDDKKNNEKCVETLKNVTDETQISPRLLRSNIPQQHIQNGKDTVATSSSIPQNISKIMHPAKDILIPEKNILEQSNSNSMQNSNTNSVYSRKTDELYRISEKISKNIQSQDSFTNQENDLLSEISTSTRESKQDSSKSQESTTFAAQQNSVSPDNSMHPQKFRQYSNQDNATFITRQQSNISAYNSTSLHKLKQYSNQSQETTILIPNQPSSLLYCDSTSPQNSRQCLSQSEESATLITTQKRSTSPCNSTNPQELEQSLTRSQASASLIISQQSTVSPQNSTSPEILKPSPKKSPIKNRVLQKKTPINFDEIVVLNEKRSKKSKEYPPRLLRSDFHQPPTTKLSKVIEREEVVVLIHDEPKSKCLPSPKLSKIEVNSNISSECHTNNIVIKEISPIDSPVLIQKDIAMQDSVVNSNKIISRKEILSLQNQFLSPLKEFPESSKNVILENNNNMMTKYKFENIETSNSPIAQSSKPRNDKLENVINKSMKPLQSPRDTSIIEIDEVIPPRNLRSQKCAKSEDVMEIKKSPSQKSRSQKDKVVTVLDEPIPQRILRFNKDQKVENVFAAPVQKKNLRTQNVGNNVEAFSKLDEPVSQRTLRSQKHEDIEDPSPKVNSNNHNVEIKLQCVNDNEKHLPKRILRSQNGAEQDVAVSKNLKKRERKNKSEKHILSQNKVNNTSLTMVKQSAVRASKALVEKKIALRDLRRKIIARAREFKNKTPTKSSNEKVIKEIKDITILRTDKTRILRSKTIVHKKTRKNGNISSTIKNKKNEQGNRMPKKISAKIESRLKCSKKRKCVLKFLPTKKVLRRKCKEPNKVMINRKPSVAVKISNRVRRKMFNNSMKSQKVRRALTDKKENRRIQTENYTVKQMQNKIPKTKSKHEEKKVILASVIQKNPRRFPKKTIKNNPTSKLNSKHIKKNPDKNNLRNQKSSKDKVGKENEQKKVSKKNYKKSSNNQKSAVENCETIENEEKDHKELNKIVEREEVKEDIVVRKNIVDESITKRKSDQPTSENVLSKRLRKTSSKVLHATVSTVVDDGSSQVIVDLKEVQNKYSVRDKAVSKRLRNNKNCLRENNDTSPNSVASYKTIIQQVSEVTEIQTKCTDCNKTILQKIPYSKTNSIVDGNNSTLSKVIVDVVPPQVGDTIGNTYKNRDITVFDFNETELEPVVPPMRFNSPKKDKNSKIIEEHEVSEKYNKNYSRKLKLTEFSTNHDHLQTTETANTSEENTQPIPRTEEVTKKKLYSRIEKPEKSVAKVKKSRTRTVVAGISSQNIDAKEISSNVKSKERLNTKEETDSIKTEPKLYSLIEKPSKKSINVKATNTPIRADESLNPSRSINGSSATPLAETNTDAKPSPKKSPMKQATITDMFNKMKLKKDQSSAVRNVFSPPPAKKEPTTVKSISKENSKESQSSTKMPPPKIELPWNKSGDAEDEDSDCESRMEWMPEEYAEYKFKYTAKKLMTNKPILQCRFCLLTLPSYYFLNKHKLKHLESDKPYKCQQCEETFSDVVEYTAHIRIHKGKHPYTCKKCDERFWTKNDYDAHMPVHILIKMKTPEKKYRCDVCGKTFSKLCDVERHTRVHTGEKPCVCNICNKRFQQSHNLSKHLLIHLDIKPFNCEICNKQFSRVDILDRHILTHSVKKPAMCQHCPKGFIRQSQLDVHMKKYHPNADRNIKRETVPAK